MIETLHELDKQCAPNRGTSSHSTEAFAQELMRDTLYPASNVVFAAQDTNPADVKPAKDPSVAVNPLESTYGKWQAVENASMPIVFLRRARGRERSMPHGARR